MDTSILKNNYISPPISTVVRNNNNTKQNIPIKAPIIKRTVNNVYNFEWPMILIILCIIAIIIIIIYFITIEDYIMAGSVSGLCIVMPLLFIIIISFSCKSQFIDIIALFKGNAVTEEHKPKSIFKKQSSIRTRLGNPFGGILGGIFGGNDNEMKRDLLIKDKELVKDLKDELSGAIFNDRNMKNDKEIVLNSVTEELKNKFLVKSESISKNNINDSLSKSQYLLSEYDNKTEDFKFLKQDEEKGKIDKNKAIKQRKELTESLYGLRHIIKHNHKMISKMNRNLEVKIKDVDNIIFKEKQKKKEEYENEIKRIEEEQEKERQLLIEQEKERQLLEEKRLKFIEEEEEKIRLEEERIKQEEIERLKMIENSSDVADISPINYPSQNNEESESILNKLLISELESKIDEYKQQNTESNNLLKDLNDDIKKLDKEKYQCLLTLSELKENLKNCNDENKENNKLITEQIEKLEQLNKQNEDIKKSYNNETQKSEDLVIKLNELQISKETEIKNQINKLNELRTLKDNEIKNKIDEMNTLQIEKNKVIQTKIDELKTSKIVIDKLNETKTKLEWQVNVKNKKIDILDSQVKDLNSEKNNLIQQNEELDTLSKKYQIEAELNGNNLQKCLAMGPELIYLSEKNKKLLDKPKQQLIIKTNTNTEFDKYLKTL